MARRDDREVRQGAVAMPVSIGNVNVLVDARWDLARAAGVTSVPSAM